ncbi:MAG TPA: hypothetical protein PLD25_23235 [Chloroflexota bacterium]|nr:hypothetical protein [Chloroflexota bacterium]HUM70477.1 hypothetical protein [Chloroflexota bacterium]
MEINQPRIRSLMRQAARVEEAGKRAAAEQLYRQILDEAPEMEDAWLGLARMAADPAAQEEAFERALELNPENKEARVGLADLRGEPVPDAWRKEVEAARTPEPEPEPVAAPMAKQEVVTAVPAADGHDEAYEFTCYRHPDRVTSLRCYNCHNPICASCTNKTSVGYICPDCKRELEDKFFNASATDYIIAALVSFPLSLIAGYLVWRLSGGFFFIFIMIFIGGAVGGLIGRLTKKAIGGRRGRYLPHLVLAMMAVGVALPGLPILLAVMGGGGALFAFITPAVYLFVAGGSAFYWMK